MKQTRPWRHRISNIFRKQKAETDLEDPKEAEASFPPPKEDEPFSSDALYTPLDLKKAEASSSRKKEDEPIMSDALYTPLDPTTKSIRIVTIQPAAESSADIICTLTNGTVSSENYIALSYVWGDETDKQTIQVNDTPVLVTRNLYDALVHIRSKHDAVSMWIDALCINQRDVDERSHQVKQMIDVYRSAQQTYIWLGEDIENMDAGLSLLNWLDSLTKNKDLKEVIEALTDFAQSDFRKEGWEAVTELVKRPWFSRVWIIQEVVFGKDPVVFCGSSRFSWSLIDSLASWRILLEKITWSLLKHSKSFYCGDFLRSSNRLEFLGTVREYAPIGKELLPTLVHGVRRSDAKDKRDKIYAIQGLLKEDMQLCEVDYRKSIPEIYTSSAVAIFNKTNSLEFLSWNHDNASRQHGYGRLPDLPSWVPSWTSPGEDIIHLHTSSASLFNPTARSLYSATQDSRHMVSFDASSGKMRALGFVMDVIEHTSPPCTTRDGVFTGPTWLWVKTVLLESMSGVITEMAGPVADPKMRKMLLHFVPQFWRIILADQWEGQRIGPSPFELRGAGTIPPRSMDEAFKIRSAVSSYEFNCAFRWRSIYLGKRHAGLVPATAQPGDVIFAILGSPVPYLVRQCEGGYRLLGECYVHLGMDGEAMAGGRFEPQFITLV